MKGLGDGPDEEAIGGEGSALGVVDVEVWFSTAETGCYGEETHCFFDDGSGEGETVQEVRLSLETLGLCVSGGPEDLFMFFPDTLEGFWMRGECVEDVADCGAGCIVAREEKHLDLAYGKSTESVVYGGFRLVFGKVIL